MSKREKQLEDLLRRACLSLEAIHGEREVEADEMLAQMKDDDMQLVEEIREVIDVPSQDDPHPPHHREANLNR